VSANLGDRWVLCSLRPSDRLPCVTSPRSPTPGSALVFLHSCWRLGGQLRAVVRSLVDTTERASLWPWSCLTITSPMCELSVDPPRRCRCCSHRGAVHTLCGACRPQERARIIAAGGRVTTAEEYGVPRVWLPDLSAPVRRRACLNVLVVSHNHLVCVRRRHPAGFGDVALPWRHYRSQGWRHCRARAA
jgi:hypothetical protein